MSSTSHKRTRSDDTKKSFKRKLSVAKIQDAPQSKQVVSKNRLQDNTNFEFSSYPLKQGEKMFTRLKNVVAHGISSTGMGQTLLLVDTPGVIRNISITGVFESETHDPSVVDSNNVESFYSVNVNWAILLKSNRTSDKLIMENFNSPIDPQLERDVSNMDMIDENTSKKSKHPSYIDPNDLYDPVEDVAISGCGSVLNNVNIQRYEKYFVSPAPSAKQFDVEKGDELILIIKANNQAGKNKEQVGCNLRVSFSLITAI